MIRKLSIAILLVCVPITYADKKSMQIEDLIKLKRVADPQISPDGKWVVYQVTEVLDITSNKSQTHLWLVSTDGKASPRQLTASGKRDAHPRWSPDGKKILFESSRSGTPQLYVIDISQGGEARKITDISTGAGNAIWSPDGSHIAFVSAVYPEYSELSFKESDEKNKERNDVAEKNPVKAKIFTRLFYRHWVEYVEDKRQHLFVCKADGTECHDATPGNRDAYPTSTTFSVGDDFVFSPDGKNLIFNAAPEKNESWSTNYDLCKVSITNNNGKPQSGRKPTSWESLTTKNPAADGSPRISPDGKKIAYRAQKKSGYEADKWEILVSDINPDGTLTGNITNLNENQDLSIEGFAWLDNNSILAHFDYRGSSGVYAINLINEEYKKTPKIIADRGQIGSLSVSADGKTIVCTQSRLSHPAEVHVFNSDNLSEMKNISQANSKVLSDLDRTEGESVSIPVGSGIEMQMWILKPPGFDPKKKWPVAYLIHGGPQGAWENGWSFRWNPQLWAAQGYVVVLPNPRGSTGFGQKFVDEISGDWGGKCYRDLTAGLEYIKKLEYVDKDRIGSAGASFGGYMQNWFAVSDIAKDLKCLISHCSVWNFESMWGTTDELWFDEYEHGGLPWEIPGKYREFSPHTKAGNLGKNKTPMLVIHNDLDFRCPIGQGHELFSALQRQSVPSRFVNFPDEGHWVMKPANSKFWHEEVFGWLKKYVPPGGK